MADYSKDIASAQADIQGAGLLCKLLRDGAERDVYVLLESFKMSDIDGELIRFTDRKGLMAGGHFPIPDVELDKLVIPPCDIYPNGDIVRLVKAEPLAPNGQAILWELVLRK